MRVPLMMPIFRSAFALGRPRDSYSQTSAPVKLFNIPPNSLAVSQPSKYKNLPPAACRSKFNCALLRSLRFPRKVTPQKQKPPNPASSTLFHPPDIHLPRITRFDSVADLSILNYEFPGTSPFNDPIDTNVSSLWTSNQGPQARAAAAVTLFARVFGHVVDNFLSPGLFLLGCSLANCGSDNREVCILQLRRVCSVPTEPRPELQLAGRQRL